MTFVTGGVPHSGPQQVPLLLDEETQAGQLTRGPTPGMPLNSLGILLGTS